jgi:hypothetical protein
MFYFSNVNVLVSAIDTIGEGEDVQYMGPNTLKWTKKYIRRNPNFKYGSFST